jgi:hypothetical protein
MTPKTLLLRGKDFVLLCLLGALFGCSANSTEPAVVAPRPSAGYVAMTKASELFALGRDAALAGDFECAREFFRQSIAVLRPEDGPAPSDPELLAFSYQLYESALRYEALAGPAEEAGTSDGQMASELNEIAQPGTTESIVHAQETIDSDTADLSYDIPITINDAVLKILAAFQNDERIHGVISRGLSRSGRYLPMIHRIFGEEGIPRDLAQIALIESSFLPHARSPMSAHGIWQFMPRTGRQFGLTANSVVDERSDPEKATRAAARYLS